MLSNDFCSQDVKDELKLSLANEVEKIKTDDHKFVNVQSRPAKFVKIEPQAATSNTVTHTDNERTAAAALLQLPYSSGSTIQQACSPVAPCPVDTLIPQPKDPSPPQQALKVGMQKAQHVKMKKQVDSQLPCFHALGVDTTVLMTEPATGKPIDGIPKEPPWNSKCMPRFDALGVDIKSFSGTREKASDKTLERLKGLLSKRGVSSKKNYTTQ